MVLIWEYKNLLFCFGVFIWATWSCEAKSKYNSILDLAVQKNYKNIAFCILIP